jgi:hypothetical protein
LVWQQRRELRYAEPRVSQMGNAAIRLTLEVPRKIAPPRDGSDPGDGYVATSLRRMCQRRVGRFADHSRVSDRVGK